MRRKLKNLAAVTAFAGATGACAPIPTGEQGANFDDFDMRVYHLQCENLAKGRNAFSKLYQVPAERCEVEEAKINGQVVPGDLVCSNQKIDGAGRAVKDDDGNEVWTEIDRFSAAEQCEVLCYDEATLKGASSTCKPGM